MVTYFLNIYKEIKSSVTTINWNRPWTTEENYISMLSCERNIVRSGFCSSKLQYKSQMYGVPIWNRFILQIFCLFSFLFLMMKGCFANLFKKPKHALCVDVAYFYSESIFSSKAKAGKRLIYIPSNALVLSFKDILFLLLACIKTGLNFVVISAAAYRMGQIRFAMQNYRIAEVWTNMEYSCACGVIYEYCNRENIILKNFMHGEKVLTLRDAFTHFHELYVWDEHYANIFRKLKVEAKIIVDNPWVTTKKVKSEFDRSKKICYFLKGIETEGEIQSIEIILDKLRNRGYSIYFKKHPRQANKIALRTEYTEMTVFDNNIENLYKFEYIIAQYSTLLWQCYCNNQEIIVDDISNPELVKSLDDREYIFFNKEFSGQILLLSRYLK